MAVRRATTKVKNSELRRQSERRHRREHILLAAERVFSRRPFDEASMQEIAEESGIGMKGLYQHFSSKETLFTEVVSTRLAEIDAQTNRVRGSGDPLGRLVDLAEAYSAFFLERPQFFPVFAAQKLSVDWDLDSRFTEHARHKIRQIEGEVLKATEAGVKAGVLAAVEPRLLASIALGFFMSVIQYQLLVKKPLDTRAFAAQLQRFLFKGIGATP
jgi:TetR/AcrR family transcriptional regulator